MNNALSANQVIGRDALLKKMGAKQPTSAQKEGLAKRQTSSATAVIASAVTSAEATVRAVGRSIYALPGGGLIRVFPPVCTY